VRVSFFRVVWLVPVAALGAVAGAIAGLVVLFGYLSLVDVLNPPKDCAGCSAFSYGWIYLFTILPIAGVLGSAFVIACQLMRWHRLDK
jgi:hypothetical protein